MQLQLGVGVVVWTMPSMVHRLQVADWCYVDRTAEAGAYALVAGLPASVLEQVGIYGRPGVAALQAERLLERQGCNLVQLRRAMIEARAAILDWYHVAMDVEEARGNSGGPPAPAVGPPDQTLTTPTDSVDSDSSS